MPAATDIAPRTPPLFTPPGDKLLGLSKACRLLPELSAGDPPVTARVLNRWATRGLRQRGAGPGAPTIVLRSTPIGGRRFVCADDVRSFLQAVHGSPTPAPVCQSRRNWVRERLAAAGI